MIRAFRFLLLTSSILLLCRCDPPVQELKENGPNQAAEQFIKVNQYMQQRHQDHIAAFLERVGWPAEVSPSGLWVVVEKPGEGKRIRENMRVSYTFQSTLLDGTPCYQASIESPKQITIGSGGVEAIFLIPPHLAHGNFGDRVKIPGNSVLIYRIQVLIVE